MDQRVDIGRTRLHALDLMRGLCALGVATYHFSTWSTATLPPALKGVLAMFGTYGVSVFFILSGYSLAHAYGRHFESGLTRAHVQAYFQRRLGRLGPLFAVAVVLSLAGRLLVGGKGLDVYETLANLALLFGFVSPAATPVVGGWSIGVEVVFYVVFPLLLLLRDKARYILVASVFMAAWIARDLQGFGSLSQGWQHYVLPANHAVFFAVGAYMRAFDARIGRIGASRLVGLCVLMLVVMGIAAAGATELQLVTGWRRVVLVAASLAFVGLAARIELNGAMAQVAALFGGLSYPLYLIHPIVFFGVRGHVEMAVPVVLWLLAFTVVLAIVTDRWLDTPVQRRVKALGW